MMCVFRGKILDMAKTIKLQEGDEVGSIAQIN